MSPKLLAHKTRLRMEQEASGMRHKTNGGSSNGEAKQVAAGPVKVLKKRPRSSPFRIKTGCLVALRHSLTENTVTLVQEGHKPHQILPDDSFIRVWTSPRIGRDEGLALLGKRIRCFLPKKVLPPDAKRRILEGEIVGLNDCGIEPDRPVKVDLLVDATSLEHFPFLKRTDVNVDYNQLPTEKARRRARLEEQIKGINKVTVKIKLAHPLSMEDASNNGIRWVLLKYVPAKLFRKSKQRGSNGTGGSTLQPGQCVTPLPGEADKGQLCIDGVRGQNGDIAKDISKSATTSDGANNTASSKKKRRIHEKVTMRHLGDGNDLPEQQVSNFRWMASRFHEKLFSLNRHTVGAFDPEVLSAGFVGEVLRVDPTPSDSSSTSVATVTLRRILLPEHLPCGRMPHHGVSDVFADHDNSHMAVDSSSHSLLLVPVEHVVIVRKTIRSPFLTELSSKEFTDEALLSHSYSIKLETFFPLIRDTPEEEVRFDLDSLKETCHRCRRNISLSNGRWCQSDCCPLSRPGSRFGVFWCSSCLDALHYEDANHSLGEHNLPCCNNACDCTKCRAYSGSTSQEILQSSLAIVVDEQQGTFPSATVENLLRAAGNTLQRLDSVDFGLPFNLFDVTTLPISSAKPTTKVKSRSTLKPRKDGKAGRPAKITTKPSLQSKRSRTPPVTREIDPMTFRSPREDYTVFKASCVRLEVYEPVTSKPNVANEAAIQHVDRPRNLREAQIELDQERDEKKTLSRTSRANQRRFMKDVNAMGAASLGLDKLATRESNLRFDRSSIHAWGVFADEEIKEGEMIIEYRGEIIGNAMTEKREKEYERAKIGSDYMFRIDGLVVCDATKQGNVARFINASCDPNCFTKIIALNGDKRIVIYAKRDIDFGEELSYDYKFPLEYDELKRIPCYCGARDCRGFMNWDKRYVAVPSPSKENAEVDGQTEQDEMNGRGARRTSSPSENFRVSNEKKSVI